MKSFPSSQLICILFGVTILPFSATPARLTIYFAFKPFFIHTTFHSFTHIHFSLCMIFGIYAIWIVILKKKKKIIVLKWFIEIQMSNGFECLLTCNKIKFEFVRRTLFFKCFQIDWTAVNWYIDVIFGNRHETSNQPD